MFQEHTRSPYQALCALAVPRAALERTGLYLFVLMLGGCAVLPDALPISRLDVPSSYTQRVPGRWALVVPDTRFNTEIEAPSLACGGMSFPIDMDRAYRQYLVQGFGQIADEVVPVDHLLSEGEIRSGRFSGQIVVGSSTLVPNVNFVQHGLSAYIDSNMAINATLDVDGKGQRLLHKTLTVTGISHVDAGLICQNAAGGLARAVDSAMQQMTVDMASAFSSSADIRLIADAR
jgi:hypothetical protein